MKNQFVMKLIQKENAEFFFLFYKIVKSLKKKKFNFFLIFLGKIL